RGVLGEPAHSKARRGDLRNTAQEEHQALVTLEDILLVEGSVAVKVVPLGGRVRRGPDEHLTRGTEVRTREKLAERRDGPLCQLPQRDILRRARDAQRQIAGDRIVVPVFRQKYPARRVIAVPGLEGRQRLGELVDLATDRGVLGRRHGEVERRQEQRDQDRQDQDDGQQLHQRETARSAALARPAADGRA